MLCIKGGTVIDGRGGSPIPGATILIDGERIKEIGPGAAVPVPQCAAVVEASGKYILPGLIDSHVHYRDYMPELFLNHGVTSVKDTGNVPEWIVAQRDGIRKGKIPGPRVFIAGRTGAIKGFEVDIEPPGAFPPATKISSKADAVELVKYLAARKVDQIKVGYGFSPELLSVISTESHSAGLQVTSHVTISARDAVASGIDCLEHGTGVVQALVDEPIMAKVYQTSVIEKRTTCAFHLMRTAGFADLAAYLVDRGTRIVPDFILWAVAGSKRRSQYDLETLGVLRNQELAYIPQGRYFWWLKQNQHFWLDRRSLGETSDLRLKTLQDGYRRYQDFIAMFVERGGRIITGTDTGFMLPGLSLHHELQEMVDAGISPMQALMSATSIGADFLGANGKDLGVLEKGKLADLVIVEGDPLKDISNTKNVVGVFQGGVKIETGYNPCFTNPLPSPRKMETHANRIPSIIDVEPFLVIEGEKDLEIRVTGSLFSRYAVLKFAGGRIPTKFITPSELKATIPAPYLSRAGTFPIVVENPPPDGGESHPAFIVVAFA